MPRYHSFVYSGIVTGLLASSAIVVGCTQASEGQPQDSARAQFALVQGDFDNDGHTDLAVGVTGQDFGQAGRVLVFKVSAEGAKLTQTIEPEVSMSAAEKSAFGSRIALSDDTTSLSVGIAEGSSGQVRSAIYSSVEGQMKRVAERVLSEASFAKPIASSRFPHLSVQARNNQPALTWDEMTPLQKHVAFFDQDGDGDITVVETYEGLNDLGVPAVLSAGFAVAINAGLGSATSGTILPTLTINVRNIQQGMHASDTGIYDNEGYFVQHNFDRLFSRWDKNGDNALSLTELGARVIGERDLLDIIGFGASTAEFGLLWAVAQEGGVISKTRMQEFYDGSLFYDIAESRDRKVRPRG